MKQVNAAAASVPLLGLSCLLVGSTPGPPQTDKAVADEVLTTARAITDALARCDDEAARKLETGDYVSVGPTGHLVTATEARERDGDRYCRPHGPANISDTSVRVYGGDTAIVNGRIVFRGPDDQNLPAARFTAVFVKENGQWKAASYQGTTIRQQTTQ
jgi:ketosteroid isomerase-like protein